MTPDEIVAWIRETRGIQVSPDSARRIGGLLAAGRGTLAELSDDSLFDAEPAQMVVALQGTKR